MTNKTSWYSELSVIVMESYSFSIGQSDKTSYSDHYDNTRCHRMLNVIVCALNVIECALSVPF